MSARLRLRYGVPAGCAINWRAAAERSGAPFLKTVRPRLGVALVSQGEPARLVSSGWAGKPQPHGGIEKRVARRDASAEARAAKLPGYVPGDFATLNGK